MKLSAKSRYGMLGFIEVARAGSANVRAVAQKYNISEKFLETGFNSMKKGNLLSSKSGSGGGYRMAGKPEDISVFELLSCLEGDAKIADRDFDGSEVKDFIFDNVWQKINEKIETELKNIKIKDVL